MPAGSSTPPSPELIRTAKEALSGAVRADDAAQVTFVLEQYPMLASYLNDALLPDQAFGATPLLAAVYQGNRQMIDILLEAGADINARSHWWAGSFGVLDADTGLAPYLIERGAFVDIHAAARLGMLDRARDLVSSDPGLVHARGGDGQTPLHVAASVAIAEYLLEHGAEIDAQDVDHESTPAQYAIRDRQEIARYLVERGCRTDVLMLAALGDVERVRRHLATDPACIRTTVSERYFPKRNPRSGGSIYQWTLGTNKSAHLIAREFGHADVFDLLMAHTPGPMKLAIVCELGDGDTVRSMLREQPGLPQALGADERARIATAARDNKTEAVRLMLGAGWPVDVRGQHGGTPLHWAAWHGNTVMVEELLRHQAPLELTDHDHGGTPLGWALHGSVHGWNASTGDYPGTVHALVRAGAALPAIDEKAEISEPVRSVLRSLERP